MLSYLEDITTAIASQLERWINNKEKLIGSDLTSERRLLTSHLDTHLESLLGDNFDSNIGDDRKPYAERLFEQLSDSHIEETKLPLVRLFFSLSFESGFPKIKAYYITMLCWL